MKPIKYDKNKTLGDLISEFEDANYDPYLDFRNLAKFYTGKITTMPDISRIPLSSSLKEKIINNQPNISDMVLSEFNEFSSNQSVPKTEYFLEALTVPMFIAPEDGITINISGNDKNFKKIILHKENCRIKIKTDQKILFMTHGSLKIQIFGS